MALNLNGNGTTGISSPAIKNFQDSDFKTTLSATPTQTTTGGSTSTATTSNRVLQTVTSPTTITSNLSLVPTYTGTLANLSIPSPIWTSSNPAVATINSVGYVTYVANGIATFYCKTNDPSFVASYTYMFSSTGGGSVITFLNWADTSPVNLPAQMNTNVDNLISSAGEFSSAKLNLYSSINDSTGIYVRNTSVWTGEIDLSGIPAWSSYGTTTFFGALVTPTDMVVANHVLGAFQNGVKLRFVDSLNVTYTATCAGTINVFEDLSLVHLTWTDSTPTTLKIMTVLPSLYQIYCPDYNLNYFPVIGTNQFRQVFVQDSYQTIPFSGDYFQHYPTTEINRMPWTLSIIGGDSSNPIMTIINGQPVLICCNYTTVAGPSVADNITNINSALSSLGSSYTLTVTNLVSPIEFPTF